MSKHDSVVDLDIVELAALMLSQGELGTAGMVSLIDESLSSFGPIANLIVDEAMNFRDRTEEYKIPRNYKGNILNNKIISERVVNLGTTIMTERGLLNDDGTFANPILEPVAKILSNPYRVIHNLTLLSEFSRDDFVKGLTSRMTKEQAEAAVPETAPNGYSYPVTSYAATIISTEHGGVVIAPNDYNAMIFDLQLIPPVPVGSFIQELTKVASEVNTGTKQRTMVYGAKMPGGNEINAAVFSDNEGNWSSPFESPEDDIEYRPMIDVENGISELGIGIAHNATDLLSANALRGSFSLPNLEAMGNYVARLSVTPLAIKTQATHTSNDVEENDDRNTI